MKKNKKNKEKNTGVVETVSYNKMCNTIHHKIKPFTYENPKNARVVDCLFDNAINLHNASTPFEAIVDNPPQDMPTSIKKYNYSLYTNLDTAYNSVIRSPIKYSMNTLSTHVYYMIKDELYRLIKNDSIADHILLYTFNGNATLPDRMMQRYNSMVRCNIGDICNLYIDKQITDIEKLADYALPFIEGCVSSILAMIAGELFDGIYATAYMCDNCINIFALINKELPEVFGILGDTMSHEFYLMTESLIAAEIEYIANYSSWEVTDEPNKNYDVTEVGEF